MAQPDPQALVCVPQGELTITTDMEDLSTALFYDTVPETWVARAYPSMMGLAAWYTDLLLRIRVRTVRGAAQPRAQHPHPQSPQEHGPKSPPEAWRPPPAWPSSEQGRKGLIHARRLTTQALPPQGRKRQLPARASCPQQRSGRSNDTISGATCHRREPLLSSHTPLKHPATPQPPAPVPSRNGASPGARPQPPARWAACHGGHTGSQCDPTRVSFQELEAWTTDFALPTTVWLAGFFNPQSFLTAIMQSMARKNEWPLDKMCLSVEVTKKTREDMTAPPREGSYVYGLFMEGQRALGRRSFQSCPALPEERLALGGNRLCTP